MAKQLCSRQDSFRAARAAETASFKVIVSSNVYDRRKDTAIPRIKTCELRLGNILNNGRFSNVYEVISFQFLDNPEMTKSQKLLRSDLKKRCLQGTEVVVKCLREETISNPAAFRVGASDLAKEAKLLVSLSHKNIIELQGICHAGVAGFANGRVGGFFIVLDRLEETLSTRIMKWQCQKKKIHCPIRKRFMDLNGCKLDNRLNVALDICCALKYLHSHKIIHRDLKPENIGFDKNDTVKLFDFGLAKELDPLEKLDGDCIYHMTGKIGTLMYMAPEVANSSPYNLSADVYSFSILFWEILSMNMAFENYDYNTWMKEIFLNNLRPSLDKTWSRRIRNLLKNSWSVESKRRLTAEKIYQELKLEIIHEKMTLGTFKQHHIQQKSRSPNTAIAA